MDTIHQADISGENEIVLVDSNIRAVGKMGELITLRLKIMHNSVSSLDDIAVDWIANNLYWVDSVWARIEALNLDSQERAEIVRLGANTHPRSIAVDPIDRYIDIDSILPLSLVAYL